MIELIIIKYLLYKSFYNKYRKYIINNKQHNVLYKVLDELHNSLDRDITFTEFQLSCLNQEIDTQELLLTIAEQDIGEDVAESIIEKYCVKQWAHNLALKSIAVSEGTDTVEALHEEYNKLQTMMPTSEVNSELMINNYTDIYKKVDRTGGLQWRLPWLNESIGGLHKGDFGFVFARTNAGKSTFVASEISNVLKQIDRPLCFFFNEEAGDRMNWRIFQAYFGATEDRLKDNIDKCQEIFDNETKGMLHFYNMTFISKSKVEQECKALNPAYIVIDNIDKVHGFKGDREDIKLGSIYTWARELAKTYCPVLAVCQAGATADNKKWLQHTDIMSAHTSKSSEADFILGIGATNDIGGDDIRYLRLLKNKFRPGEHRHECRIDALTARYREI
jgi:replicative DNA helicase